MTPRKHARHHLAVLGSAYAAGTIPIAGIAARITKGIDLRTVGNGTVSGSALYDVSGLAPLIAAGCVELTKGAIGPLLAGHDRPLLGATAAALAITGHNWSPWLGGKGGRGISLALGAGLVLGPEATVVLGASLGIGKLMRRTGTGTFVGLMALPFVLSRTRGRTGWWTAVLLITPIMVKRLLGNDTSLPRTWSMARWRLIADRDESPR